MDEFDKVFVALALFVCFVIAGAFISVVWIEVNRPCEQAQK